MTEELNAVEEVETAEVRVEVFEISGDKVITKIQELVHEGNIRRINLKTDDGKTLIEIPLTLGVAGAVVGTILAPVWAAIGAIAAMLAKLKIVVERIEKD